MNESEKNKELIQRIAETLRNHAEPYREGAWERFAATQGIRRKRVVWWPYGSAAAILLAAAAWFLLNPTPDVPTLADLGTQKEQPTLSKPAEPEQITDAEFPDTVQQLPKRVPDLAKRNAAVSTVVAEIATPDNVAPVEQLAAVPAEGAVSNESAASVETENELPSHPSERLAVTDRQEPRAVAVEPLSRNEEYAATVNRTDDQAVRKWNLGVAVTPSMTSEKLNVGGGIAIAYQLSDKFSVGSGVSIGRLGMAENPDYRPSYEEQYYHAPSVGDIQGLAKDRQQYKRDVSLTSNVIALDIPLDLRYEVFNGFYTSVGVSYVAVLSEQRTEHFIGGLNENTFGSDNVAGKDLAASTTVGYMSEKMDVQPLRGKGYTGFMNFSVGRKMPLSKHVFFSIEPYFKLPIGRLSKEEMDFTNGGIRIITGF
ncbi:hypothetical protein ACFQRK_01655 [Parapedobacter sp. GCM10030251]|uniref:hypothetical protein n=1 Tax=Parapedobacter sp. GCM10030251 TaxID=3273419 RepID=UPI003610A3A9